MRKNKFDDENNNLESLLIDSNKKTELEYSENKIVTFGTLNQKRCPSTRKLISVPVEVIDFIERFKDDNEDTHETLIYAHMLLKGKRLIEKELIEGDSDYEIKSNNL